MRKKDPALLAMLEQQRKAEYQFYRWYGRMRRAVNAMEKLRRQVQRLSRRVREHETAATAGRDAP